MSPDQLMDSKLRCVFELPDNKVAKTTVSQTSKILKKILNTEKKKYLKLTDNLTILQISYEH